MAAAVLLAVAAAGCSSSSRAEPKAGKGLFGFLKGCPPYQEEVAFSSYVPVSPTGGKEPPATGIAEAQTKDFGLKEGELARLGPPVYLDKMFTGIKSDFEQTGVKLSEIANGFEAEGIKLEKVIGADGKTKELRVTFDGTIGFELGSARLTKIAAELVGKIGKAMRAYPETNTKLGGHVDCCAPREYNLKLSQGRSDAAKNALISRHGIASGRVLESIGYADDRMLIPVRKLEPRNRRVELIIVTK